jgi:molybdopterin-binding protein
MLPLLSWLPDSEKERTMKLSARNVIPGTIKDIEVGAVNAEVSVEVAPDLVMTSIITKGSYKNLEFGGWQTGSRRRQSLQCDDWRRVATPS